MKSQIIKTCRLTTSGKTTNQMNQKTDMDVMRLGELDAALVVQPLGQIRQVNAVEGREPGVRDEESRRSSDQITARLLECRVTNHRVAGPFDRHAKRRR